MVGDHMGILGAVVFAWVRAVARGAFFSEPRLGVVFEEGAASLGERRCRGPRVSGV